MPLREDLQPFIAALNSLGHEPEILARSGESVEAVEILPEGLSDEIQSLLQSSSPPAPRGEAEESFLPSAEEGLDFSSVPAGGAPDDEGGDFAEPDLSGETGNGFEDGFDDSGLDGEELSSGSGGEPGDLDIDALLADFPVPGGEPPESLEDEALPEADEEPEQPSSAPEDEPVSFGELDDLLADFPSVDTQDDIQEDLPPEDGAAGETAANAAPAENAGAESQIEPDEDFFNLPETNDEFTISDMGDSPAASAGSAASHEDADDLIAGFSIPGTDAPDMEGDSFGMEDLPAEESLPEFPEETAGEEGLVSSGELDDLLADFPEPDSAGDEELPAEDFLDASPAEGEAVPESLNIDDFQMPDFTEKPDDDFSDFRQEEKLPDNGEEPGGIDEEVLEEFEDAPEELPGEEDAADDLDLPLPDDELGLDDSIELPGEEGPREETSGQEFPSGGEEITGSEAAPSGEFSLGDFGAEFGVQEEVPADLDETEINIPEGASNVIDSAAAAGATFTLSDADFARMQETLQSLPLNIKIVVEELIGDQKADEAAQLNLIRMLVKGASVRNIAAAAGKLIGRTLAVPKGYAKSSGTAWEVEKGSFAYFLRETFWPVFKIAAAGFLAACLLVFIGYSFIYKPIHAHILLSRGYEMLQEDRFRDGNALFTEGYNEWPFKEWYFDYARTFIEKKQYQLAREKYEQLISEYDDYLDAKGIRREREKDEDFVRAVCEYAHFESVLMEDFEGAEKIIQKLLAADMYNYDGLLEAGDNYIRWAEYDETRFADKYEEARKCYAIAMGAHGESDEILFRFLDVFMHTGNTQEVLRIKSYFQANPKKAVDPARYAELGGYLLDKNESAGEVRDILFRALEADKTVPDIHYHLARFYNKADEPREERIALDNAMHLYGAMQPISRKSLWRLVDSCGRSGELFVKQKSFLEAEGEFKKGIERYEDGVKKTLIKKDAALGRLYSRLGDIYYYQSGDLEAAYAQFANAEDSLVRDPALYYKKGYIRYAQEDYSGALREFARTEEAFPSSRNLLFALGNVNYMRSNFSVAEGYYSFLTERLEADKRRIGELIPEDRASDRAMILNLVKAYNNLGVILYKMGERTGSAAATSRAMVLWENSTELATNYARESETLLRRDTKDIAYLNLRQILNPLPNYELQIYGQLPMDMNEIFFSTELK